MSDGTNASWDTYTYASYGQQTRSDLGAAIKTPTGLISANVNGTITYRVLEHSYQSCVIGKEHPVLGQTSNRCMGFIGENFQPAQKVDAVEPTIGYTGIKFKQATIVESQYIPTQDGVNDTDVGDYSATFENFLWLNPGPEGEDAYLKLRISTSPRFQFGFTGFKPAQDNTVVAVGKDGAMYVNSKPVSESEMAAKITEALENKKEKVVFINADEEALYSAVMLAMDQLHQAGVEDIALITERRRPASRACSSRWPGRRLSRPAATRSRPNRAPSS
jgi:hypothetical protein